MQRAATTHIFPTRFILRFLPFLLLCNAFFYSCRAFGNFWENNKENKTTYGDPADAVAPTVPGSPTGVSGGSTQINLSWTAASDNCTPIGALIYEICQSTTIGGCAIFTTVFVTAAGATSFNATGLTPSTTYYYRVRARDTANNAGTETAEFSASTSAPGTVNTPTYSPVAGTFNSAQLVSISSSTSGSTICYTSDGVTNPACNAVPTCTTGTTYAAAVNVSTTTTLKAIACKNGSTDSAIATSTFTIDTTPPTVSGVTSSTTNGTLGVGQTISIQVNFSEVVNVTGTPQLTLATGSPATTVVNYISGSGTSTLNFDYVTAAGNFSPDLDYASTGALALNGGTIQDAAGNAATLTLATPGASNSLGFNKNLIIDGVGPAVTGVTASTANGTYIAGNVISIQVTFNESVTVTGTPQLTLATGSPPTTAVNYTSGSGSAILVFNYTVAAGNSSADLDYANAAALALNGGTINDASGNAAALTLVTPGSVGSLANSKNIVIDTGGLVLGAAISFSAISSTGLTVNWGAATDDITAQVALQYKVVKDNTAIANINTVGLADAKSGGDLLQNWTAGSTSFAVTGLTAATTYHFAVLVRDGAGNMALYTPASQATSGGGGLRRLIIPISGMTSRIYDSTSHTIIAGPVLTSTPSNGGFSFPVTVGPYANKRYVGIGGGTAVHVYDPVGNSFATGTAMTSGISGGSHFMALTTGPETGNMFFVRAGTPVTQIYNPNLNTYAAGPNVSGTPGAGGHNFAITSGTHIGKFLIIHGVSTTGTTLLDPTNIGVAQSAGPSLTGSAGNGAHSFEITAGTNSGKILIVHGNNLNTTSLYDPSLGTIGGGPTLTAMAGLGAHAFAITAAPSGRVLVVHGNTTASTSIYNPSTLSFDPGPALPNTVAGGGHAFTINGNAMGHLGKTLVINGGGANSSLFDPAGPSFTNGPAVGTTVATGAHSWDIP
ncbi:MAG: chitobiase/beta-hexosaminidase C-terminal domain-containing protein [Turneriella sp.]|nr:chitobiase/beta-hexosaminidase C-terminal domain-containing protein [Turneriella sp.]